MKYFLNFLVYLTVFCGCTADEPRGVDTGSTYFPLQKGIFQVYSVQEVHYTATADPLEVSYQLKAEVVDSFPSGNGQFTYIVHRSTRENDGHTWTAYDTWAVRKDKSAVIVSEGNNAYVKMKFPLTMENVWDGNAFNAQGQDEYRLSDIGRSLDLDGLHFPSTVTVEQEDNGDVIVFKDERREIYAQGVGLIYKEIVQLNYCTGVACLGQQRVDDGIEMNMVIREYGKL